MSNHPFMQFYVSDYMADTMHLTTEQHGMYLLLLMTMWKAGGSLPNDPKKLSRICRVSPRRWHIISGDVIEFFDVSEGKISQKRLVEEYKKAVSKSEKRIASGKLGGKAKSLKNKDESLANARDLLKHLSEPEPEPEPEPELDKKEKNTKKRKSSITEDWEPDQEYFDYAKSKGWHVHKISRELEIFKNHYIGKKELRHSWIASWRTWVLKDYNHKNYSAAPNTGGNGEKTPFGRIPMVDG